MKPTIKMLLLLALLANGAVQAANMQTLTIYFDKDKAYLTNQEAQKLQMLKGADYILLKGHTDNDGGNSYNIELSRKRVDAVKAFVRNLDSGIKVEADYFGESKPINSNVDEKEKTQNRRVEITYVSDPLMRTAVPVQQFEIDNGKDLVFICKHGTEVHIPAGAFGNKKVSISISEYYTASEIFAANLSTRCNKVPIETAGMINIAAESDGKSVEPSVALEYRFPRKNKQQDFHFFSGVRDSALGMNWELPKPKEQEVTEVNKFQAESVVNDELVGADMRKGTDTVGINEGFLYTANYTADLTDKAVSKFFEQIMAKDRTLYNGCLKDSKVDVMINREGRITAVKTNYDMRNAECDRNLKEFIWSCLPERFRPFKSDSYIHISFEKKTERQMIFANAQFGGNGNGTYLPFDNGFKTDYEDDKIVLSAKSLGWINCDRFLSGTKFTNYIVQTEPDANVRLVMKKYRSYFLNECFGQELNKVKANQAKGEFTFVKIPDNEEVTIISTKKVNDVLYLAVEDAKTSSTPFSKLNYKPVTAAELEETIKKLKI